MPAEAAKTRVGRREPPRSPRAVASAPFFAEAASGSRASWLTPRIRAYGAVWIVLVAVVGTARQREYGNVRLRDGIVIGRTEAPLVNSGDAVVHIAS